MAFIERWISSNDRRLAEQQNSIKIVLIARFHRVSFSLSLSFFFATFQRQIRQAIETQDYQHIAQEIHMTIESSQNKQANKYK